MGPTLCVDSTIGMLNAKVNQTSSKRDKRTMIMMTVDIVNCKLAALPPVKELLYLCMHLEGAVRQRGSGCMAGQPEQLLSERERTKAMPPIPDYK